MVLLIDAYQSHKGLLEAVEQRLREEFAELRVEINEEKSRLVDLDRGESFGFLGGSTSAGCEAERTSGESTTRQS